MKDRELPDVSWRCGKIHGNPLPYFAGGVAALVSGVAALSHTIRLPVVPVLLILLIAGGLVLLYVAYEKCRRATWDENGVTFSFLGTKAESVAWHDVTALDRERKLWTKESGNVRMIGSLTSTVKQAALLEVATIGYAKLFRQAKIRVDAGPQKRDALVNTSELKEILNANNIWRKVAVDLAQPSVDRWELSPQPGIYVYKTHGSRTQAPLLVIPATLYYIVDKSITHLVKGAWQAALLEGSALAAILAVILIGIAMMQKAAKQCGVNTNDTVEVSSQGVRVWKNGNPTPWLQYPRKFVQRALRWLPGGTYQLWSNGEEQHAIDPRFLVPLQDDLPPEFAYAATEGGGWMTPDSKPIAQHKPPDPLPEKGQ